MMMPMLCTLEVTQDANEESVMLSQLADKLNSLQQKALMSK